MKILTFSTRFSAKHPRKGDATFFMEKILCGLGITMQTIPPHLTPIINDFQMLCAPEENKYHTIRGGNRWKAGDMVSLRVWSDKPYRSKQIEFAQVEIKRVQWFDIKMLDGALTWFIDDKPRALFDAGSCDAEVLAKNDGLSVEDFVAWFPSEFSGQIICWHADINY